MTAMQSNLKEKTIEIACSILEKLKEGKLESVSFSEKEKLPNSSGIYFAAKEKEEVLYIGKALNLNTRCGSSKHHKIPTAIDMGAAKLYFVLIPVNILWGVEQWLIGQIKPPLNNHLSRWWIDEQEKASSSGMSIGSIPMTNNASNWLKVSACLSRKSVRAKVAEIIEEEISKSLEKWLCDLEVAAAERDMHPADLWASILRGEALTAPTNTKASIEVQFKQRDDGQLHKG
jgi:hypothetical protein